jgi:hypothetical protein
MEGSDYSFGSDDGSFINDVAVASILNGIEPATETTRPGLSSGTYVNLIFLAGPP